MEPKILLIEDHLDIVELIKFSLEKNGYKIFVSNNAEDGLKKIQKNKIDLIVLDIMLPGMSGIEYLDKIRKIKKYDNVKILIFTVVRFNSKEEKDLIKKGAQGFLNKPLPISRLEKEIKTALKKEHKVTWRKPVKKKTPKKTSKKKR